MSTLTRSELIILLRNSSGFITIMARDNDGDLDLSVVQYPVEDRRSNFQYSSVQVLHRDGSDGDADIGHAFISLLKEASAGAEKKAELIKRIKDEKKHRTANR